MPPRRRSTRGTRVDGRKGGKNDDDDDDEEEEDWKEAEDDDDDDDEEEEEEEDFQTAVVVGGRRRRGQEEGKETTSTNKKRGRPRQTTATTVTTTTISKKGPTVAAVQQQQKTEEQIRRREQKTQRQRERRQNMSEEKKAEFLARRREQYAEKTDDEQRSRNAKRKAELRQEKKEKKRKASENLLKLWHAKKRRQQQQEGETQQQQQQQPQQGKKNNHNQATGGKAAPQKQQTEEDQNQQNRAITRNSSSERAKRAEKLQEKRTRHQQLEEDPWPSPLATTTITTTPTQNQQQDMTSRGDAESNHHGPLISTRTNSSDERAKRLENFHLKRARQEQEEQDPQPAAAAAATNNTTAAHHNIPPPIFSERAKRAAKLQEKRTRQQQQQQQLEKDPPAPATATRQQIAPAQNKQDLSSSPRKDRPLTRNSSERSKRLENLQIKRTKSQQQHQQQEQDLQLPATTTIATHQIVPPTTPRQQQDTAPPSGDAHHRPLTRNSSERAKRLENLQLKRTRSEQQQQQQQIAQDPQSPTTTTSTSASSTAQQQMAPPPPPAQSPPRQQHTTSPTQVHRPLTRNSSERAKRFENLQLKRTRSEQLQQEEEEEEENEPQLWTTSTSTSPTRNQMAPSPPQQQDKTTSPEDVHRPLTLNSSERAKRLENLQMKRTRSEQQEQEERDPQPPTTINSPTRKQAARSPPQQDTTSPDDAHRPLTRTSSERAKRLEKLQAERTQQGQQQGEQDPQPPTRSASRSPTRKQIELPPPPKQQQPQDKTTSDDSELWSFDKILDHKNKKKSNGKMTILILVKWSNGEETWEPLETVAKDDPVSCAEYASQKNLLDHSGWKRFKQVLRIENNLEVSDDSEQHQSNMNASSTMGTINSEQEHEEQDRQPPTSSTRGLQMSPSPRQQDRMTSPDDAHPPLTRNSSERAKRLGNFQLKRTRSEQQEQEKDYPQTPSTRPTRKQMARSPPQHHMTSPDDTHRPLTRNSSERAKRLENLDLKRTQSQQEQQQAEGNLEPPTTTTRATTQKVASPPPPPQQQHNATPPEDAYSPFTRNSSERAKRLENFHLKRTQSQQQQEEQDPQTPRTSATPVQIAPPSQDETTPCNAHSPVTRTSSERTKRLEKLHAKRTRQEQQQHQDPPPTTTQQIAQPEEQQEPLTPDNDHRPLTGNSSERTKRMEKLLSKRMRQEQQHKEQDPPQPTTITATHQIAPPTTPTTTTPPPPQPQDNTTPDDSELWSFDKILDHKTKKKSNGKMTILILVKWSNGQETWEPLETIAEDDPISCAEYARENNLLEQAGWKRFKQVFSIERNLEPSDSEQQSNSNASSTMVADNSKQEQEEQDFQPPTSSTRGLQMSPSPRQQDSTSPDDDVHHPVTRISSERAKRLENFQLKRIRSQQEPEQEEEDSRLPTISTSPTRKQMARSPAQQDKTTSPDDVHRPLTRNSSERAKRLESLQLKRTRSEQQEQEEEDPQPPTTINSPTRKQAAQSPPPQQQDKTTLHDSKSYHRPLTRNSSERAKRIDNLQLKRARSEQQLGGDLPTASPSPTRKQVAPRPRQQEGDTSAPDGAHRPLTRNSSDTAKRLEELQARRTQQEHQQEEQNPQPPTTPPPQKQQLEAASPVNHHPHRTRNSCERAKRLEKLQLNRTRSEQQREQNPQPPTTITKQHKVPPAQPQGQRERSNPDDSELWSFDRILDHKNKKKSNGKMTILILVKWSNGEETWEPLETMAKDDPVSCAEYARDKNLLEQAGWKRFKQVFRIENSLEDSDSKQQSSPDANSTMGTNNSSSSKIQRESTRRMQSCAAAHVKNSSKRGTREASPTATRTVTTQQRQRRKVSFHPASPHEGTPSQRTRSGSRRATLQQHVAVPENPAADTAHSNANNKNKRKRQQPGRFKNMDDALGLGSVEQQEKSPPLLVEDKVHTKKQKTCRANDERNHEEEPKKATAIVAKTVTTTTTKEASTKKGEPQPNPQGNEQLVLLQRTSVEGTGSCVAAGGSLETKQYHATEDSYSPKKLRIVGKAEMNSIIDNNGNDLNQWAGVEGEDQSTEITTKTSESNLDGRSAIARVTGASSEQKTTTTSPSHGPGATTKGQQSSVDRKSVAQGNQLRQDTDGISKEEESLSFISCYNTEEASAMLVVNSEVRHDEQDHDPNQSCSQEQGSNDTEAVGTSASSQVQDPMQTNPDQGASGEAVEDTKAAAAAEAVEEEEEEEAAAAMIDPRQAEWDILVQLLELDAAGVDSLGSHGIKKMSDVELCGSGVASTLLKVANTEGFDMATKQKFLVVATFLLNGGQLTAESTLAEMARSNQAEAHAHLSTNDTAAAHDASTESASAEPVITEPKQPDATKEDVPILGADDDDDMTKCDQQEEEEPHHDNCSQVEGFEFDYEELKAREQMLLVQSETNRLEWFQKREESSPTTARDSSLNKIDPAFPSNHTIPHHQPTNTLASPAAATCCGVEETKTSPEEEDKLLSENASLASTSKARTPHQNTPTQTRPTRPKKMSGKGNEEFAATQKAKSPQRQKNPTVVQDKPKGGRMTAQGDQQQQDPQPPAATTRHHSAPPPLLQDKTTSNVSELWSFDKILDHKKKKTKSNGKMTIWILVKWSNGEQTWEPLQTIAEDDPVSCAEYAREKNLLEEAGWNRFKQVFLKQDECATSAAEGTTNMKADAQAQNMRMTSSQNTKSQNMRSPHRTRKSPTANRIPQVDSDSTSAEMTVAKKPATPIAEATTQGDSDSTFVNMTFAKKPTRAMTAEAATTFKPKWKTDKTDSVVAVSTESPPHQSTSTLKTPPRSTTNVGEPKGNAASESSKTALCNSAAPKKNSSTATHCAAETNENISYQKKSKKLNNNEALATLFDKKSAEEDKERDEEEASTNSESSSSSSSSSSDSSSSSSSESEKDADQSSHQEENHDMLKDAGKKASAAAQRARAGGGLQPTNDHNIGCSIKPPALQNEALDKIPAENLNESTTLANKKPSCTTPSESTDQNLRLLGREKTSCGSGRSSIGTNEEIALRPGHQEKNHEAAKEAPKTDCVEVQDAVTVMEGVRVRDDVQPLKQAGGVGFPATPQVPLQHGEASVLPEGGQGDEGNDSETTNSPKSLAEPPVVQHDPLPTPVGNHKGAQESETVTQGDLPARMDMQAILAARSERRKGKTKKKAIVNLEGIHCLARPDQLVEETQPKMALVTGQELLNDATDGFQFDDMEIDPVLRAGKPSRQDHLIGENNVTKADMEQDRPRRSDSGSGRDAGVPSKSDRIPVGAATAGKDDRADCAVAGASAAVTPSPDAFRMQQEGVPTPDALRANQVSVLDAGPRQERLPTTPMCPNGGARPSSYPGQRSSSSSNGEKNSGTRPPANEAWQRLDTNGIEGSPSTGLGAVLPAPMVIKLQKRIKRVVTIWAEEEQMMGNKTEYWHIIPNKGIESIAAKCPTTLDELKALNAFVKPRFLQEYGDRLIRNLQHFVKVEGLLETILAKKKPSRPKAQPRELPPQQEAAKMQQQQQSVQQPQQQSGCLPQQQEVGMNHQHSVQQHSVQQQPQHPQQPSTMAPTRFYPRNFVPTVHYVICGRGKKVYEHCGNQKLLSIVGKHVEEYSTCTTEQEKSAIIQTIVRTVEAMGSGGFIQLDAQTGLYFPVDDRTIREKIKVQMEKILAKQQAIHHDQGVIENLSVTARGNNNPPTATRLPSVAAFATYFGTTTTTTRPRPPPS